MFRWCCFGRPGRRCYNPAPEISTTAVTQQENIIAKLSDAFAPAHLEVVNESGGHNVPPGSETHFKVVIVCDAFEGESRIARHRAVHEVLAGELAGGVHALALHAFTADEWRKRYGDVPMSPPCLGGKAAEVRQGGGA